MDNEQFREAWDALGEQLRGEQLDDRKPIVVRVVDVDPPESWQAVPVVFEDD